MYSCITPILKFRLENCRKNILINKVQVKIS